MSPDEFSGLEAIFPITDLAFPNDWGVGMLEKLVFFVPGAVFGDRVRVKIAKKKRNFNLAQLVKIEEPSPFRTDPHCPHFGSCGGCAFQNLLYEKQLELKANHLLQTLRKIGGITPGNYAWEGAIPSPTPFHYRNKMEFAFGEENRKIFLGLRERTSAINKNTKKTIPLRKCLISSRAVEEIFPAVAELAQKTGLPSYNALTKNGFFRNLVFREGKNTGEIMLILVTRSGSDLDLNRWAEILKEKVPRLASFFWVQNDRLSDVVDFEKKNHIWGKTSIEEKLGGLRFSILPESFFQPNPRAAEILYQQILEEARLGGSQKALGLYCGPGTIEIFLSRAVKQVVGVDSEKINILNAEENCKNNNITNCCFLEGQVEKILKEFLWKDFDLAVLDPPRAGLSQDALQQIITLDIPEIVYVSCNPATFARDAGLFSLRGYRLRKLWAFDFFPHTPHLESLGILTK